MTKLKTGTKPTVEMPEEVRLLKHYIESRVEEIESGNVTPWNKAKLLAFRELLEVIEPKKPSAPVSD